MRRRSRNPARTALFCAVLLSGGAASAQTGGPLSIRGGGPVDFRADFVVRPGADAPAQPEPAREGRIHPAVLPPAPPQGPLANAFVQQIGAATGRLIGGAPSGFVNVYEITAYWRNRSPDSVLPRPLNIYLTDLSTELVTLSGGNEYFQVPALTWGCPGFSSFPLRAVGPQECFKAVFRISLKTLNSFRFYVNLHASFYQDVVVVFDHLDCFGFDRKWYPRAKMIALDGRDDISAYTTPASWATNGYITFATVTGNASINPTTANSDLTFIDTRGVKTGSETVNAKSSYFTLPWFPDIVGTLLVDVKPKRNAKVAIHRVTDPVAGAPAAASVPTPAALRPYLQRAWDFTANVRFELSDIASSEMSFRFDINGNGRFDGDGPGSQDEWDAVNKVATAEGDTYIHIFYVSQVKDNTAWTDLTTRRIVIPEAASSLLLKTAAHEVGHALQIPWNSIDPLDLMYRFRANYADACVVRKPDWDRVNPTP